MSRIPNDPTNAIHRPKTVNSNTNNGLTKVRKAKENLKKLLNVGSEPSESKYSIGFMSGKGGEYTLEIRAGDKKDLEKVPDNFEGYIVNKVVVGEIHLQSDAESNFDPKTVATSKGLTEMFKHTGTTFGTPTKNVKQCIYAYAPNKKALKDIPNEFNGLKIIKKIIGKTRPL